MPGSTSSQALRPAAAAAESRRCSPRQAARRPARRRGRHLVGRRSAASSPSASSRASGSAAPTILSDYPLSEAALARARARRPARRGALRALRLRRRARQRLRRTDRRRRAAPPLRGGHGGASSASTARPIRSTRISSPRSATCRTASGAALGFDRLVMLACGAERIEDVQWTPVFDPEGRAMNDAIALHRRRRARRWPSVYGFSAFRPGQEEILAATLARRGRARGDADRQRQVAVLPAAGDRARRA